MAKITIEQVKNSMQHVKMVLYWILNALESGEKRDARKILKLMIPEYYILLSWNFTKKVKIL